MIKWKIHIVLLLLFLAIISYIIYHHYESQLFWTAFGALATAAAAGTVYYAAKQLTFNAWLKVQELWTDKDFTDARRCVFARLDKENGGWTCEEKMVALQVCRKMDEVARLLPYLPKPEALDMLEVPFAQAWYVLKQTVIEERKRTKWPNKWREFEKLGIYSLNRHTVWLEKGASSP